MILRRRKRPLWTPTVAATGWGESTLAEQAWDKSRGASAALGDRRRHRRRCCSASSRSRRRPGSPSAVASATEQRLLLADARGTIWSGSAVPILTGGATAATRARCPAGSNGRSCRAGLGARAARAPRLLPERHRAPSQSAPGLGRISRDARAAAGRLGRPVAERLARRPRHAVEHDAARRLRCASSRPGFTVEIGRRAAGASTAAPTSSCVNVSSRLTTLEHARQLPPDAVRRRQRQRPDARSR